MSKKPVPVGNPHLAQHTKDFIKVIEHLDTSRHHWDIFQDFVTIAALSVHQAPYHDGLLFKNQQFDQVEEQYMKAIKRYKPNQLNEFAHLLAITQLALAQQKCDFLGHVYMAMELSNKHAGQFFTPYEISYFIARMTLTGLDQIIQEKGYISLCEPACGAGGMMIAAAQCLEEDGFPPHKYAFCVATDISATAFHMTYLQLSLIAFPGLIRHGNTLSNETWTSWYTPAAYANPGLTLAFLQGAHTKPAEPETSTHTAPVGQLAIATHPAGVPPGLQGQLALLDTATEQKPARRSGRSDGGAIIVTQQEREQFTQASLFSL